MPIFQTILTGVFISVSIWKFYQHSGRNSEISRFFWPALFLKLLAGILVGLFFAGSYDSFQYQKTANSITEFGRHDPLNYLRLLFFNDSQVFKSLNHVYFKFYTNSFYFSKLISVLNFITANNYFLNGLFLSAFSFAGCWYFARVFASVFLGNAVAVVFSLLFFPSVVFWSSGVIKESLLMGSLTFFWAATLNLVYTPEKKRWLQFGLLLLSAWLLWKIKFFLAAVVIALTGSWVVYEWLPKRFGFFQRYKLLLAFLPVFALAFMMLVVHYSKVFQVDFLFNHLVWDYEALLKRSLTKPHIQFHYFQPNLQSALINAPEAVFSSFFRPFLVESSEWLYLFAGLENTLIAGLFLGAFSSIFKLKRHRPSSFFLMLALYVLIISAVMALPTPNLGTLNRYRVTFLPFALLLLLQTPFWRHLLRRFSFRK